MNGSCEFLYDTKWYQLPIELQKGLALLISRKQNPISLTIGPFANNQQRSSQYCKYEKSTQFNGFGKR